MTKKKLIWVALAILVVAGAVFAFQSNKTVAPVAPGGEQLVGGQRDEHGCLGPAGYSWCEARKKCIRVWETYCTATPPKSVVFACKDGKQIRADFYLGDDKFVDLTFGDNKISLPRAISASGARYTKPDESIVFWNKGDTAFITENGTSTYTDCNLVE